MITLTNKQLMRRIVSKVGESEAIRLVSDAYNVEILANRMGRLEVAGKATLSKKRTSSDLIELAMQRVAEICELTGP